MASNGRNPGFVKESLEQAQVRLEAIEKEAAKVLKELRLRSKSSRKEVSALLEKFQAGELFESARTTEKKLERDLMRRANRLQADVAERLAAVQDAVLKFVGVASQSQVEELVADLERISKRLEKLSKNKIAAKKKAGAEGELDA